MPKKRKKAAKKTKRKAAKKTKKKAKKAKKEEKDNNLVIFTKNASHYKLYERRFFYSPKFSPGSAIGSSTGNSILDVFGSEAIG